MAYEWAKPGVKCVFVSNAGNFIGTPFCHGVIFPKSREVYTILSSHICSYYHCVRIRLDKAPNPDSWGEDHGWFVGQFRPIITKTQEQDVEMFLSLLNRSPLERLDLLAERMNEMLE